MTRRIRYNRADIASAINAARSIVSGTSGTRYVYATALGFVIDTNPPPGLQDYYQVNASQIVLNKVSINREVVRLIED